MKQRLVLFASFIFICLSSFPTIVLSHSGGTDSSGGHWNHSTGEYHYHHGYPEHQHPGGVCPYESDGSSSSSRDHTSTSSHAAILNPDVFTRSDQLRKENNTLRKRIETLYAEHQTLKEEYEELTIQSARQAENDAQKLQDKESVLWIVCLVSSVCIIILVAIIIKQSKMLKK